MLVCPKAQEKKKKKQMLCNKRDVYYSGRVNHSWFYLYIFHNCSVLFRIVCHSQLKGEKCEFENAGGFYVKMVLCYKISYGY